MKATKIISLLLAIVCLAGVLTACGGDEVVVDGGDRGNDGSWANVDFKGQVVNFCISVNQYDECTFPAANIYTKGPDTAGSNEVAKEVLARNAAASKDLGVEIVYSTKDLTYNKILEDVRGIVQTASKNSPDIYNNDMYGLSRCMIDGLLWNVVDPGDDVKNYLNLNAEGFYTEFMKGCTFDQSKVYMVAGDYFIDMIRMAWVVYVNNDLFLQHTKKMPTWCQGGLDTFYEFIADGFWDIDEMTTIAGRVFVDGSVGMRGETEPEDDMVGVAINPVVDWVLSASSQITLYYQDKENGYEPKVMESINDFQLVSNKYTELAETNGVYYDALVVDSTKRFLNGNFLFAFSRLGEMESAGLRNFSDAKGLVPVPKWNQNEQDDYHTVVHDQAELGCILNTAKAYSAASALLQYLNEESDAVVYAYYDKGLKYKYNDDKNAREMMDIVRETTDSPFGFQIGVLCQTLYTGTEALKGLQGFENHATLGSLYAGESAAYKNCMKLMIEKFKELK